eukprot:GILK01008357.1.p1 GENE.GILK01008357.1~~GILK01008357.1.p1  ORF type:complete len:288 (+),score=42.07 GILK01008357.1:49-864(+)
MDAFRSHAARVARENEKFAQKTAAKAESKPKQEAPKLMARPSSLRAPVRRKPVSATMKAILDTLRKSGKVMTVPEVEAEAKVEIANQPDIVAALQHNHKVIYEDRGTVAVLKYKARHAVSNIDEIRDLIRSHPEGIPTSDLLDAYPTVVKDIETLKADTDIRVILNTETKVFVLYPKDPVLDLYAADSDVKQAWAQIKVPDNIDLAKELHLAGLSHSGSAQKRRTKRKAEEDEQAKKKRKQRAIKLVNVHDMGGLDLRQELPPSTAAAPKK